MDKQTLAEELAFYIFEQESSIMTSPDTLAEVILEFLNREI